MFHSKPSCSLKSSKKAGSSASSASVLDLRSCSPSPESADFLGGDKQMGARRPSTCFRPFLIFMPSYDVRLSKANERRASIVNAVMLLWSVARREEGRGRENWPVHFSRAKKVLISSSS